MNMYACIHVIRIRNKTRKDFFLAMRPRRYPQRELTRPAGCRGEGIARSTVNRARSARLHHWTGTLQSGVPPDREQTALLADEPELFATAARGGKARSIGLPVQLRRGGVHPENPRELLDVPHILRKLKCVDTKTASLS
jgi:hypothetical protein